MAYLNLDPDYFEHPKTKRLIGLLGKGAESYPIKLWCYCAKYHPEKGIFLDYSAEEIEGILCWDGEKTILVNALVKVGFLHKKGNKYEINDWLDHEGHIAKFKQRSKLAAKARWKNIIKPSNATSNAKGEVKQSSLPNLSLPNQALPIKNIVLTPDEDKIYQYAQANKYFNTITKGFVKSIVDRFKAPDAIIKHLKEMTCWLEANPARQKSNYARFILNWLKSESDKKSNMQALGTLTKNIGKA